MKVIILEKCYTGTVGNMFAGEEHDLDDRIATKLIARNLAELPKAPKAKKKGLSLTNRKVKDADIEAPEAD